MTTLHQEYDTYKTDFKNKQKDEVIKELDLLELKLEDLIENRTKCENGSMQYFITFTFTLLSATTAVFWKIADMFNEIGVGVIVLIYLAIALIIVGIEIRKHNKEVDKVNEKISEERNEIKELKMKIKILKDLIK